MFLSITRSRLDFLYQTVGDPISTMEFNMKGNSCNKTGNDLIPSVTRLNFYRRVYPMLSKMKWKRFLRSFLYDTTTVVVTTSTITHDWYTVRGTIYEVHTIEHVKSTLRIFHIRKNLVKRSNFLILRVGDSESNIHHFNPKFKSVRLWSQVRKSLVRMNGDSYGC